MNSLRRYLLLILTVMWQWSNAQVDHWETIVREGDIWKYMVPDQQPDATWTTLSYDDAAWAQGPSGFGYGDDDDQTILETTISVYLRFVFEVNSIEEIGEAILHMDYDDGFVAYLNGVEIARSLMTGNPPAFDQGSDGLHEALLYRNLIPEAHRFDKGLIVSGSNVLAVEVHNDNIGSSDLTAIPFLSVGITSQNTYFESTPDWFVPPLNFESSNLPIVVISTGGAEIPNDPKIPATIGIISNPAGQRNHLSDSYNELDWYCGIELRGESSLWFDKKSYGIEIWDEDGNDLDTTFLNFPPEEDFVLHGPYADKSLMNNVLTMHLARSMGHYSSRTRFVELVINDDYKGLYVTMERIKRDKNRVDISKLNPDELTGDDLTGGYIIRIDKGDDGGWNSNYDALYGQGGIRFQYYYPSAEDIHPEQGAYIKNYFDNFEDAINSPTFKNSMGKGYTQYIDLRSFVDTFILNELSKNVDAYRLSTYFYKEKDSNGGKLHAGPFWDFNLAYGNADYCGGDSHTGWVYYQCNHGGYPIWWNKMQSDTVFSNALKCRWEELRTGLLETSTLLQTIDSLSSIINEAQERNFQRWPTLGIYLWPNPPYYVEPLSHQEIISVMKDWVTNRLAWIDDNLAGESRNCDVYEDYSEVLAVASPEINIQVFPNPASGSIEIRSGVVIDQVELRDLSGKLIDERSGAFSKTKLELHDVVKGLYLLHIRTRNGAIIKKVLVD